MASSSRKIPRARRSKALCRAGGSWFSVSSLRAAAKEFPSRSSRFSSIEWVTLNEEVKGSGVEATILSKVFSDQETKPWGGFFLTTWRSFFESSPNFATALFIDFLFSMANSGAWTTTVPAVS